MHLSIVTPSPKARVDSDDFPEQYDGGNTEILQQFLAQTLRRMPEIYGLDFSLRGCGMARCFCSEVRSRVLLLAG